MIRPTKVEYIDEQDHGLEDAHIRGKIIDVSHHDNIES
jgi:hypothetical protein